MRHVGHDDNVSDVALASELPLGDEGDGSRAAEYNSAAVGIQHGPETVAVELVWRWGEGGAVLEVKITGTFDGVGGGWELVAAT